jgi:hypothetical protein
MILQCHKIAFMSNNLYFEKEIKQIYEYCNNNNNKKKRSLTARTSKWRDAVHNILTIAKDLIQFIKQQRQ